MTLRDKSNCFVSFLDNAPKVKEILHTNLRFVKGFYIKNDWN
jgi:hypothetical protein